MLERIEEIQGVGLLHQANGKPHTCRKATLIYADNGRGKSTLATALRSVSTGDASLIADRKTVDGTLPPKVILQFGSGHRVIFEAGVWTERRPEVLVFDADFIERNVHSGGSVSTGQRKNLLEFALGEASVAARLAVDKSTTDAKVCTDKVQTIAAQLSTHHAGMSLSVFETLPLVPDADNQIGALQRRINAAGNVAAILAKPVSPAPTDPTLDLAGVFEVLGLSLTSVHADAEETFKKHAATLANKAAEGWLSEGQQFDDGKSCPYCAQSTAENDLIRAYQSHFNVAYNELKKKVAALQEVARTGTAQSVIDSFTLVVAEAANAATSWQEEVALDAIHFDATDSRVALRELATLLVDLCGRKQASPAEAVGETSDLDKAKSLWMQVLAPMRAASAAINAANVEIAAYKTQLATEKSISQLQQELQRLNASKRRYEGAIVDLFRQFTDARKSVNAAEKVKKSAREDLDELMKKTLTKYEKSVNALLVKLGAAFSIKGMDANFRGAAPRSEYGLQLRGTDVALEGGSPSFASALSDGDKRTLAFAFFVASASADPKLATRTIVIDDPMCSLDLNRKHHTKNVLKSLHSSAEQLVVLAHDPYFIRDLRDALIKEDSAAKIALFQLGSGSGGYTNFAPLDVDQMCESAYFRHHRLLNDFATGSGGDSIAVAKAIRPMLEGYLHRRFPVLIPKSLLFGEVVKYIRNAVAPSPLCHAQNLVTELNEINEYAGQFHHDTNPGGLESVGIVEAELQTYVLRALDVAHKGA